MNRAPKLKPQTRSKAATPLRVVDAYATRLKDACGSRLDDSYASRLDNAYASGLDDTYASAGATEAYASITGDSYVAPSMGTAYKTANATEPHAARVEPHASRAEPEAFALPNGGSEAYCPKSIDEVYSSHATAHTASQGEEYFNTQLKTHESIHDCEVTGTQIAYTPRARHSSSRRESTRDLTLVGNPPNIWFNWNGHSWCAFEVLGIPSTSSVALAQEAFRQAIGSSETNSHPFLNEAIQAIERCCK